MSEFRREWLPEDWEEDYRKCIHDVRLDPAKENFFTWMTTIRCYNAALRGSCIGKTRCACGKRVDSGWDVGKTREGAPMYLHALYATQNEWMYGTWKDSLACY
jgi:hypothetical protein